MDAQQLVRLAARAETGDPLECLVATTELRRQVERIEAGQVRRARNAGASWAEIAAALGVSKQAAHRKFGGLLHRAHDRS